MPDRLCPVRDDVCRKRAITWLRPPAGRFVRLRRTRGGEGASGGGAKRGGQDQVVVTPSPGPADVNLSRYEVGVVAYAEAKFCRNVTTLWNPHAAAIRVIGHLVVSRRLRASSSRRARTHLPGVVPATSRNRRVKFRVLMPAWFASSSMPRSRSMCARAQSRVGPR